tara:strand:+ start:85 stop:285 length:201 start_codon:yes stop_codon:yes gene_type:complete
MFGRKDDKLATRVSELEEKLKSIETKYNVRIDELEKTILELSIKQRRDDGFFKMLLETIKEWRTDE